MQNLDPNITAAIIAAVVSLITLLITLSTKNYLEKRLHIRKLEADHEFDQRKKIKSVLSKYKVRLVNSCEALVHRLSNHSKNYPKGWLEYNGNFKEPRYYLASFAYRILSVYYWVLRIEKELIYLDSTISTPSDLNFIKYLNLFKLALAEVKLFNGLYSEEQYPNYPADHFYTNEIEGLVSRIEDDDYIIDFETFKTNLRKPTDSELKLMHFLDGISPDEERLRWERLHALHLIAIIFLNSYGYDFQQTSGVKMKEVLNNPRKSKALDNLAEIIKGEKLEEQVEAKRLIRLIQFP